jgi:hypothetical protein
MLKTLVGATVSLQGTVTLPSWKLRKVCCVRGVMKSLIAQRDEKFDCTTCFGLFRV